MLYCMKGQDGATCEKLFKLDGNVHEKKKSLEESNL